MKKKILVWLCFLSCIMNVVYTQQSRNRVYKKDVAKIAALTKCDFSGPDTLCCKRGKRGKTGPRGRSGRNASGPNLNEFFINTPMMNWFATEEFGIRLPDATFSAYDTGANIIAWSLLPSIDDSGFPPIGATFNIPQDLDVTQPVMAVIHMLVANDDMYVGNQAKLQISSDYRSSYEELGSLFPAAGFAAVQTSSDFSVVLPTPPLSTNLEHISVAVPLDTTNMSVGDWAFITVGRIAPAANEFSGSVYLSAISIQYTRLN